MTWHPNYRPSNGTEGDYHRARTCDRCVKDHHWHNGEPETHTESDSCPIILHALTCYPDPGPVEWERDDGWNTRCTAFEGPCECAND